jgi:hypothetical protein
MFKKPVKGVAEKYRIKRAAELLRPIAHQKSKTALDSVSQPNTVLLKIEHRKLHCIRTLIRHSQNKTFFNTISHD